MQGRYFFGLAAILALLSTGVGWPGQIRAAEPVSISHTLKSYVSDGPAITITLNLQLENKSGAVSDISTEGGEL